MLERVYYTINEEAQRIAKMNISFSDYKTGSATEEYRNSVDAVYDIVDSIEEPERQASAYYHAKKYAEGLANWYNKDASITMSCPSILVAGWVPANKKYKQNLRWDANMRYLEKVNYHKEKVSKIKYMKDAIMSDDEKAVEKLEEKLEARKAHQDLMKAVNKALRIADIEKSEAMLDELGFTDEEQQKLRKPDYCGRIGYSSWELSNNNAEIHRLEGRIKAIKEAKREAAESKENPDKWKNKWCEVVEDENDMRIRLLFDGKPSEEIRNILKHNGFRWSPRNQAWQRQLNRNGKMAVRWVLEALEKIEDNNEEK